MGCVLFDFCGLSVLHVAQSKAQSGCIGNHSCCTGQREYFTNQERSEPWVYVPKPSKNLLLGEKNLSKDPSLRKKPINQLPSRCPLMTCSTSTSRTVAFEGYKSTPQTMFESRWNWISGKDPINKKSCQLMIVLQMMLMLKWKSEFQIYIYIYSWI